MSGAVGPGGSTDLAAMLAGLEVARRPDPYTVVQLPWPIGPRTGGPSTTVPTFEDGVGAAIVEDEGLTVVATLERATREGWPVGFVAAWLTLTVHSSLEAVGLTAAVSAALAEEGIACNVIAAHHHDHLLVPLDRADDAVAALEGVRRS